MGKQSKNGTGSGGDERNMYYRRYKSTSNPSKASTNENLTKTDSESSSRSYNSGASSQQYSSPSKSNAKSKLRTPVKVGLGQPTNRGNKPNTNSDNKEVKKPAGTSRAKSQLTKMKQESATTEKKQIPANMEADKEVVEQIESQTIKESTPVHQENGDSNGLYDNGASLDNNFIENQDGQMSQNGEGTLETHEKAEEFNLQLEVDENCFSFDELLEVPSQITADENTEKQLVDFMEEIKDDSKIDSESCSVDVVESTTSEIPEPTESTAGSENKEKISEDAEANSEAVKEVKDDVKNSQSEAETKADQSSTDSQKDTTFGKTLRTISGRHSIGRMRHMKLRDRQPSPNSSLFVNTSSASLAEDVDLKSIHRRTPTADLTSTNGTEKVLDRKRKLIDVSFDTQKKIKTDESKGSFLSSSIEMIKKPFRRSVKTTTSKKPEKEQIHVGGGELVPYGESNKKWCLIM